MLDYHPELMGRIKAEHAKLMNCVLPAILGDDSCVFVTYNVVDNKIIFTMTHGKDKVAEAVFCRDSTVQSENAFIAQIKAYFFDLCGMFKTFKKEEK